ncbi:hypothetical protein [Sinimarinibacterium flocculans]|uniref:hypothetical protein n=1 Tax=Sinimarinibacterium flocculans TaxID=985250 RepID=UPI00351946C1
MIIQHLFRGCAVLGLSVAGLLAMPAFAESPPSEPAPGWCAKNPQKCEELKQQRAEYCSRNPQTCETRDARRDARKAYCDQNPGKCEALKQERQDRIERTKEYCAAHPAECEEKKQAFRDRQDERRERFRDAVDDAP